MAIHKFCFFKGSPQEQTVQFRDLTLKNHKIWFKQIRKLLAGLGLKEHLVIGECWNSDDDEDKRWHDNRRDVWKMLSKLARAYVRRTEPDIKRRLTAVIRDDGQYDTTKLFAALINHFETEIEVESDTEPDADLEAEPGVPWWPVDWAKIEADIKSEPDTMMEDADPQTRAAAELSWLYLGFMLKALYRCG